jgi:hypothetical protein
MSYGVNYPFGLQPRSYLNGNVFNGQGSEYLINGNTNGSSTSPASYATSIFLGDLVKLAADGTIQKCAAGDASIGVFWGCKYFDTTNTFVFSKYWPASTPTFLGQYPTAYVVDDPNVIYSAQVFGTAAVTGSVNTINIGLSSGTASDLNYNYNINVNNGVIGGNVPNFGSIVSGNSTAYVDLTTQTTNGGPGTTATQLKLIRLEQAPGNNFGVPFNNGLFLINNDIYKGGVGTSGV